ncbi:MAG: S46 family peptidase [Bdellovibrionaceae bacterium]|nr:S46 family peptidase [Pseudobdellovibrionaceae bacterium]
MNFFVLFFSFFIAFLAAADEGMWTFNHFPSEQVKAKYKFDVTKEWLDHARLSSARLADGCSGSFVSSQGLVMTNHHCAHSCIEQLSKSGKDYVADGFFATNLKDELKCPELEINKLVEILDVTQRIRTKTVNLKGKEFNTQLKAVMSEIEKDCSGTSETIRCDVVTLYHGGQYHLYKYQRYQDVRMVFAPELSIAFFGGDPDNFNFPRYALDTTFLRIYEQGKPLQTSDYFKWSMEGAIENELTFVTGHPGRTSRLLTISELEFVRDVRLVHELIYRSELRGMLTQFQQRGKEQKRYSTSELFYTENGIKAMKGQLLALQDQSFFASKINDEKQLRQKINAHPKWKKEYGSAWDDMASAYKDLRNIYEAYRYMERDRYRSTLFTIAKNLVRAAGELPKPNEQRYREFAESGLPQFKQNLLSSAPIYDDLEIENLTFGLTKMRETLGPDHAYPKKLLGNKSPREMAEYLIKGTKLKDVSVRQKLFDGGQKAINESKDPLIQLALLLDPDTRAVRTKYEDDIEGRVKQASEKIAQAMFAVYGSKRYPDATFTLRMSYGQVKGYEQKGEFIKPFTNIAGAFNRHTGSEPFTLPKTWLNAKSKLDLNTKFNFVSTNDIIGGNSGSPVINQKSEIVGLIFDGNIQSLGGDFGFDARVNRAVSVDSSVIVETLNKIYGAGRIVNELGK